MKPLAFLSAQFFLLTLSFILFFDPIGISFFLMGLVWLLNKKLAYFEVLSVFFLKGQYGYMLVFPDAILSKFTFSENALLFLRPFLAVYMAAAFLYGMIMAVKLSAKLVKRQMIQKAPDLLGMIN